jgi:cytoskeletal protein RodZ
MANTSTVSAAYSSTINVTETFSIANSADNTILVTNISESGTLTASTTVPATKQTQYTLTMSGGTGSIDLTALPGLNVNETIDGTGLKVQLLKFKVPTSNANKVTVAKGGSNGYGLASDGTTWTWTGSPGQSQMFYLADLSPDVASGARIIDVTGTGTQTLEVAIVLG